MSLKGESATFSGTIFILCFIIIIIFTTKCLIICILVLTSLVLEKHLDLKTAEAP